MALVVLYRRAVAQALAPSPPQFQYRVPQYLPLHLQARHQDLFNPSTDNVGVRNLQLCWQIFSDACFSQALDTLAQQPALVHSHARQSLRRTITR